MLVVFNPDVFSGVLVKGPFGLEVERRPGVGRSRELLGHLAHVILVEVAVPALKDDFLRNHVYLICDQVRKESVAGNVERKAQKTVDGALHPAKLERMGRVPFLIELLFEREVGMLFVQFIQYRSNVGAAPRMAGRSEALFGI